LSAPGSLTWLARHEARLAWRDWRDMLTASGRRSLARASLILVIIGAVVHLPVWALVTTLGMAGAEPGRHTLTVASIVLLLFASLLTAQATETVTRSLYTRGDTDLVVSSPIALTRLFTVRLLSNAVPITVLALVLATPLVNVMAYTGGARWLAGFGVAAAFGITASAVAVSITTGLFQLLGPRRTRVVAQIVAAVIGAVFAIGIQIMAIVSYGAPLGGSFLLSDDMLARLPALASPLWLPARAVFGDGLALVALLGGAIALLVMVTVLIAPNLAAISLSATDPTIYRRRSVRAARGKVLPTPRRALRRKEWRLLRRDPWLISQTLTQLLYLLPPALLLSQSFGGAGRASAVVVMVLVTVAGQLAGALAWLAVSGEDAPDLVATAPVTAGAITRAKVEAVMAAVGVIILPILVVFALLAPFHALVAAVAMALAALSTIQIQLWFRAQAKRSHFRRRHTSSRLATFGEALVSFSWAAAAGLAASQSWLAIASAIIALLVLMGVRAVAPRALAN